MEKNWERSIPFFHINAETVYSLVREIIKKDDIVDIEQAQEGCRTSNYIISDINNHKYVLKIFSDEEHQYKKECRILNMLKNEIPVQDILKFDRSISIGNRYYIIYKYIEGITLSQSLSAGQMISEKIVKQAASILAQIHKFRFEEAGFLDDNLLITNKLKPLNEWYEKFITSKVENRIGKECVKSIRSLIKKYEEDLLKLDCDIRLVHGDFQGTNILVHNDEINGIIDWEFAMAGHPLSDIGQFFRYEEYFNEKLIYIFENEYREKSDYILPENWYNLCKIRDLANLLQLIGFNQEMPNKYGKIKRIIFKLIK